MKVMNKIFEYIVLSWIGGSTYVALEVLFRGRSHWTMFILGAICFILIGLINEISLTSQSMIINGIEYGGKRYRLNTTDQINISALSAMAQLGNKVPYHADGEICRIFEPEEMLALTKAATSWVVYHTTYFNLLKHQILEYDNIDDVNKVYYGIELKDEYQKIINTIVSSNSKATTTGGDTNESNE